MDSVANPRPTKAPTAAKRSGPSIVVLPYGSELKMRILRSIDRPISTITVEDICQKCCISRRTFYNHFKSKYSIMPWFASLARTAFIEKIGRSISLAEGLLKTYEFIYSEKDFTIFAADHDYTVEGVHDPEWDKWEETYITTLSECHHITMDEELSALLFGFMTIEAAFVKKWARDGMSPEPEVLVARLIQFVPERLKRLLDPIE